MEGLGPDPLLTNQSELDSDEPNNYDPQVEPVMMFPHHRFLLLLAASGQPPAPFCL